MAEGSQTQVTHARTVPALTTAAAEGRASLKVKHPCVHLCTRTMEAISTYVSASLFLRVHRKKLIAVSLFADFTNVVQICWVASSPDAGSIPVVRFVEDHVLQNRLAEFVHTSMCIRFIVLFAAVAALTFFLSVTMCFRRATTNVQPQTYFCVPFLVVAVTAVMYLVSLVTLIYSWHAKTDVQLQGCLHFPVMFAAVVTVMFCVSVIMRCFHFATTKLLYHGLEMRLVSGHGISNLHFRLAKLIPLIIELSVLMSSLPLLGDYLMVFMFDPLTLQSLTLFDFFDVIFLLEIHLETPNSHKEELNVLKDNLFSIGIESGMDDMISRVFAQCDLTSKTPIVLDRTMNTEM